MRVVNDDPMAIPLISDANPTVLLAEDDPVTRMLLTRQLKKAGYEVEAVTDGATALQRFRQKFYPFLLTDWEMPEMDGVSLCKAVRAMPFDGYVYTLLLTARDSKEHIIAGLEAGADDYLTKPIHEAELVARLNTGRRILHLEQSLRAASQENRWLSITDALTGAYNRRRLMEQLPREVERCRRYQHSLSVVLCDIDHFKRVNDSFGHSVGDAVLKLFVDRIRSLTRDTSDWVARYGGEEFVIVLPETPYQGGLVAAEKIRAAIAASPLSTSAGDLSITASFGVASIDRDDSWLEVTSDRLMRCADECLYDAKQNGRNRVCGVRVADQATLRSCVLTS
jgi:two-component system, cell cycle response regulator